MSESSATVARARDREDTDRWSYYLDPDFYRHLADVARSWSDDWPPADPLVRSECEAVLAREARLIDEARFNEWLELFTDRCLYWVPITPGGGDPRTEVSHSFDDRRRMTDRVYWLRTGLAFCQIPQSRTRRMITNVEVLDEPSGDRRRVRSNFVVHEFRAGVARSYPGWYGHLLERHDGDWRIAVKQVNLLDSEHGHENLTIIF
ncbi:aromatic-ring-hydroxylating dioxygenase subunit beta [Pseudonocardia bannensis]|uniref:Aromatic-ring-hydroxylating dioxygenase subunit beta n=2 Tax=Pseudonocardia bannensis TaxID=630973 RepID=A0A848DL48_9PSEU|nr:aromatic-ring-hydroxylating dioxygenase subunit beta [Pseudonocardia bannensis]